MNVIEERIPYNVHFKKPFAPTYMEQLKQMETDGMVSLRGLRKDATLFNEIVIDVNTMYFEHNGGYECTQHNKDNTDSKKSVAACRDCGGTVRLYLFLANKENCFR